MKKTLSLLTAAAILLSVLCSGCRTLKTEYYGELSSIDHAVVEPDEAAALGEDLSEYRDLVNAVLSGKEKLTLSCDEETARFYEELIKENPYGFLLSGMSFSNGEFTLSYAYSEEERERIVSLMDETILSLCNTECGSDDTKLDKILKLYYAVTEHVSYDHSSSEPTALTDPHLRYPSDSVYLALRDKTSKCYGFSYLFTFMMLQYDLDCFSVFGTCYSRSDSHMWNIFEYDGAYFTCDAAWDRSDGGYSKLLRFGKTQSERESETVEAVDFSSYHEKDYPPPVCDDTRFSVFRGIVRYSPVSPHCFYMQDFDENELIFNTQKFDFE